MRKLPWKRILKWTFFVLCILSFLLFTLTLFLWFKLQDESFQKKLANAVEERLPHPFNHKVEIGRIGGRLPGSLLISDIDLELPSGDTITLDQIFLDWDWAELLSRRFVLKRLRVKALHLALEQGKEGAWLPDLKGSPSEEPAPLPPEPTDKGGISFPELKVLLEEIVIDDLRFTARSGNTSWQQLNFSLPNLSLTGALDLGPDRMTGDLSLSQEVKLQLDHHPKLEVKLQAGLTFNDNNWGFRISPLSIETPRSHVEMQLSMTDPMSFPSRLTNPTQWLEVGQLGLELQTLKLAEKEVTPLLEAELELQDILAQGNLVYQPGHFSANLIIKTGKNSLGLVSSAKVDPVNIDLENHDTDLVWKIFLQDWVEDLSGELDGKAHLAGSLHSMETQLGLHLKALAAPDPVMKQLNLEFKTVLALKGLLNEALPSMPTISGNAETLQHEWASLNAWLDQHRDVLPAPQLDIKIDGLTSAPQLPHLTLKAHPHDETFSISLLGHASSGNELIGINLGLEASPDEAHLNFHRLLVMPEVGLPPVPLFKKPVTLTKENAFTLNRKSGQLDLGQLALSGTHPFLQLKGSFELLKQTLDVQVELPEQSTAAFLPTDLELPLKNSGKASFLLKAQGPLPYPTSSMELLLQGAEVGTPSSNLSLGVDEARVIANFDPSSSKAHVDMTVMTTEGLPLKILGMIPLDLKSTDGPKPSGNLHYTVDIGATKELQLSTFAPLLPPSIVGLNGIFSLKIDGELNPNDPMALDLQGHVKLRDGAVTLAEPPIPLENVEMDLALNPTAIRIQTLQVQQGKGLLNLNGEVLPNSAKNWLDPRWQLKIDITQWPTLYPPLLTRGEMGSDLTVSGNLSKHQVSGKVSIKDLLFFPANSPVSPASQAGKDPNIVFQEDIQDWNDFDKEQEEAPPTPDFLKTLDLSLNVELGQNNWIRHDMFRGELGGELMVKSPLDSSDIEPKGTLFLRRAELDFQGNKFEMDQGSLIFVGDLLPSIDMVFASQIKDWLIEVILNASVATEITPELRATPWLSNADIISVLLFGKPIHATSDDEKGGNMASDLAAAQGAALVGQKLGLADKGIDLEDVSSTGGRIRIGRYLHPRVYVSAAKSVGEEEGHQLSVEYLIRKAFKVKTIREDDEPLGFEVEWGKDY